MSRSPEVVILETLPQQPWRHWLSVVHTTLGRVLTKDSVHDDGLFPVPMLRHINASSQYVPVARLLTYLSLNQPFLPRSQLAVWHGPAGISA